ncbi:hypothetical protein FISHEDRAFT_56098 [Fistulina hepatica ATCC 64428]|uniref:Uncharacterized protein n=1 Tax=Fistulina hepatica ATCC 64428 TaxID=1128425 RepID=A0A0D7AK17_9AGAR|nr:hypothetical protein FISHEDRAFT_56098 [Fistulina hepatica ATCC 64428]
MSSSCSEERPRKCPHTNRIPSSSVNAMFSSRDVDDWKVNFIESAQFVEAALSEKAEAEFLGSYDAICLEKQVPFWPCVEEAWLDQDKCCTETVLDNAASSMTYTCRPRWTLTRPTNFKPREWVAKRAWAVCSTHVHMLEDCKAMETKSDGMREWFYQQYNPLIEKCDVTATINSEEAHRSPSLAKFEEVLTQEDTITFRNIDGIVDGGMSEIEHKEITHFCIGALRDILNQERKFYAQPSSVEDFARLDISIVRDPETQYLNYYVNEITRAPQMFLFMNNYEDHSQLPHMADFVQRGVHRMISHYLIQWPSACMPANT